MSVECLIANPFRALSPNVDAEVLRLKELHRRRVSDSSTLHEGVLIMISKLIEISRSLSECIVSHDRSKLDESTKMVRELDEEEKILTRYLLSCGISGDMWKGVIRFPYRMKRIGDMLESIARCIRLKAETSVPFSDAALEETGKIFSLFTEMLTDLRESFVNPTPELLEGIETRFASLTKMIDDVRTAHWDRVEAGVCLPEASSLYRDILDSVKLGGEYVEKMSASLLAMKEGIVD